MQRTGTRLWAVLLAALTVLLPACGDDDGLTGIDRAALVGSYRAGAWRVTFPDGQTFDVRAEGGSADITLNPDGTMSGLLVIPAAVSESGGTEEVDMAGTWDVSGGRVRFDQTADTFVRDLEFTVDMAVGVVELEAMETFSSGETVFFALLST